MKYPAVGLGVAFALTGCAKGATPAAPAVQNASTSVAVAAALPHHDRGRSWFSAEAKGGNPLLFVSDSGTGDVEMYSFPTLKLIGTVTGFSQPQGECSDDKGDVWVTDTNAEKVYELSREGRVENRLDDPGDAPAGCAWDSRSGDLAVMNLFSDEDDPGEVVIFPKGSGHPKTVKNQNQFYYDFGGYDGSGNLFFDGRASDGSFMLAELPQGASSASTLAVGGGKIYFPGMVQWDPSQDRLLVGDQSCGGKRAACVYQLSLDGSSAQITGTIKLRGPNDGHVCDLVQGVEANGEIAGSNNDFCTSSPSATYLWPYPAGGAPAATTQKDDSTPVGAAISARGKTEGWMTPNLAKKDLLYVADDNGEVTVYHYATQKLVGVLTDFAKPLGECSDAAGDVFIADYGRKRIYEYAHGGMKPIAVLNDAPYSPYTCAVDATSGNLAVANGRKGRKGGNIAVYAHASGTPVLFTDKTIPNFQGCAYDNDGNLLTTSGELAASNPALFAWLPKNGKRLIDIQIPGPGSGWKWQEVVGIQWDGHFFAIDDYNIYRAALINGQAYFAGETDLQGGYNGRSPYWINANPKAEGMQVVAGWTASSYSGIYYFRYPQGGKAIADFEHGVDVPLGVTVSQAAP